MISDLSIRKQLFILVIAVIVPMMAAGGYTIYRNGQQRLTEVKSQARVLAVLAAADVNRVLATNRDMLVQMANRPLIRMVDPNHCDPILWNFHEIFPRSANMTTINIHGEAICSAVPQPGGKHVMVDKAPWFKRSLEETGFIVSDPFFGPITGRWVTVLTYPIQDNDGQKIGFLGLPLDLALYQPNLSDAPLPSGTTVGVVTAKGVFVWRNLDTEKWVGKNIGNFPAFQRGLIVKDGEYEGTGVDSIRRIYSITHLKEVDWYVFVGVPASAVYSQVTASIARSTLISLPILLAVLIFALFVAQRIVSPIQALALVSRAVRQGQRNSRATVIGAPELVEVATEFNEMLDVRLRSEAALMESERNLQDILSNMPAGVMVHDNRGIIRFANQLARSLLNMSATQLLERSLPDLDWHFIRSDGSNLPAAEYPASYVIAEKKPLRDYIVGIVSQGHKTMRWLSASAFPEFDEEGNLQQVIVCFIDITERKELETALQREASDWIEAMDAFTDAVFLIDANHHLVRANKAFYTMAHIESSTAVGQSIRGLLHHHDDGDNCPMCRAREEGKDAIFTLEAEHPANPSGLPVEVTLKVIHDQHGNPTGFLTVLHDLTRAREIEEELRKLNQSLEQRVQEELAKNREKDILLIQQSRLATMGEMMHNVAHQWRQPLNTLALILQNIQDAYEYGELDKGELAKLVANGNRVAQRMSDTIDDFRNFFRPDREKSRFNIVDSLREALSLIDASFSNNQIEIEVKVSCDIFTEGFPGEFAQVLLNVLVNAKDAIKAHKPAGKVTIYLEAGEGKGVVRIQDDGGGIPENVLPKIFDPYFTTKNKGTGIGLYMSRMIMEHMGGSIEAHNLGSGAEIIITAPQANDFKSNSEQALS